MVNKSKYAEKYKDPRWQKKRLQVLERDEWTCQCCYDTESTLHVHHRYYEKDTELWEYPLEAFVTLCEACHEEETSTMKYIGDSLLKEVKSKFLSGHITDISYGFYQMKMLHVPEVVASVIGWTLSSPNIMKELIGRYFEYLAKEEKARKPKNAVHKDK